MKVETHQNGRIEIELKPEDDIDAFNLIEFLKRVQKGQPVSVSGDVLTPADRRGKVVLGVQR